MGALPVGSLQRDDRSPPLRVDFVYHPGRYCVRNHSGRDIVHDGAGCGLLPVT